jgi:hypothetical protein
MSFGFGSFAAETSALGWLLRNSLQPDEAENPIAPSLDDER